MLDGGMRPSRGIGQGIWLVMIVLVGLNLRPFLTGIGPLAATIHSSTGLEYRGMAWLTLLPILLMGVGAFLAPSLQHRLGERRTVLCALLVLGLGSALRAIVPDGESLIATAVLCGAGVAVIQAVFPGIIKRQFPNRVVSLTGLYSAALLGGGALGAQLTPPMANGSGSWREALAWWAVPAALAMLLAWRVLPRHNGSALGAVPSIALLRLPRKWLLMGCFGLLNGGYASLVAWLAPYYQTHGWGSARSGTLVALMAVAQAAAALLLPALAARSRDRRPWLWLTLALQATGFAAFALWPDLAPRTWAMIIGAGLGGSFALCLVVALDHLPDPREAGALNALMQGGGFLIAATGPWVTAMLHEMTGNFAIGWLAHFSCVILVFGLTVRLAPEGYAAAMSASTRRAQYETL